MLSGLAIATVVVCGKETISLVDESAQEVRFGINENAARFIKLVDYKEWFKFEAGDKSDAGCAPEPGTSYSLVDKNGSQLSPNSVISLGENTIKIVPVDIPK